MLSQCDPNDDVLVPVVGETGIGGPQASLVIGVSSGFDWLSGKTFLATENPLFRKREYHKKLTHAAIETNQ